MTTFTLLVRHRGHDAFYVREDVRPDAELLAGDVRLPDGSIPMPASAIACGTCGETLLPLQHHLPRFARLTWEALGEQLDFVRG